MSVRQPREYKPELANPDIPLSRGEELCESLGLPKTLAGVADMNDGDDLASAQLRKHNTTFSTRKEEPHEDLGASASKMKELESENAELKKRMIDQVEMTKKLANSRIANITKSFEDKVEQKNKELEEVRLARQDDLDEIVSLNDRVKGLEAQIRSLGGQPAPAASQPGDMDARLRQELETLRRDNAALRQDLARVKAAGEGPSGVTEARLAKLDAENREMKKTIDNLMEVNSKLVESTKSKIALLEQELASHRTRRPSGEAADAHTPRSAAAAAAAGGSESETVRQLQQVLTKESEARSKAEADAASLRQQLASSVPAKAAGPSPEALKKLQEDVREKEKQINQLTQSLKASSEDSRIKEKELLAKQRQAEQELEQMKKEGTSVHSQLQDTKSRIRKAARHIKLNLQRLREAQGEARLSAQTLQAKVIPTMKDFYKPLKTAVVSLQKVHGDQLERSRAEAATAAKEVNGWMDKYRKEAVERRRLHNLVLELKGNIRVLCRIRPRLPHEESCGEGGGLAVLFPEDRPELEDNCIAVLDEGKGSEKVFEFDCTFGPDSTQEQVFDEVEALVTSVMDGYNVCIFAYGQTGSGKTFTMEGSETERGINPRTLRRLFEQVEARDQFRFTIELSILEIYNEEIRDLLDPKTAKKLEVRQGPDGNYVQDLARELVTTYEQTNAKWGEARANRTTFSNNVNEHSSRSHLVISAYVRSENRATGQATFGKLHLVDLAGSERLSRTHATGDRLKEAQNINKSLSALGDVIAAAASKQGHIPYRNSKLTHVLQDSLGQDSKTLMIVQASPLAKDVGESVCSLQFATRARSVELGQARRHAARPASAAAAKR